MERMHQSRHRSGPIPVSIFTTLLFVSVLMPLKGSALTITAISITPAGPVNIPCLSRQQFTVSVTWALGFWERRSGVGVPTNFRINIDDVKNGDPLDGIVIPVTPGTATTGVATATFWIWCSAPTGTGQCTMKYYRTNPATAITMKGGSPHQIRAKEDSWFPEKSSVVTVNCISGVTGAVCML